MHHYCLGGCSAPSVCARRSRPVRGVRAGTWCCVSLVSPFPPRVFRAACGRLSRPGAPFPRLLVRHSTRSVRSARSVRLPFWLSPRAPFVCVRSRPRGVRSPPPWVVWRAHLTWSRHWALVGPFNVVRAPLRVLPRSLALSGVLVGGRSGPGSPLLGFGLLGWRLGVPGGGCLGASGVGRSPGPDCPPSGRAAGAGLGRPGWDALPLRLLALWAGCRGRCGVSGVGRSPTPDCPPSGRAARAGVGRPGLGALPFPTARPLGGLPGPVWGVQGRTLSHPRLPALWAGCRGRCGESGVGRSPTPDCPPSGRAAGAGVGRPGSDALPPPTARPLGGLPGPVWGVQGRTLSHPRLPALWAGCRGRCGESGVGRSPTPDCPPSGRAAGAGVGRPGSDALPPPTARPLGGLPGPVWDVRGRALSNPRLPALWAGCRGRCGASGVGRSPAPDCSPSGRAAGAGVGRPGSGALPPPTARPLGGPPGSVWGVRGRTLSQPRLPALWAGCWGRCGASGVGRSPTPDCSPSGRAAGAGVGRPGSGALPPPTARPLGGLPGPVWGVRGRTLSHPRLLALWAGCRGRCGASGVGRSPTPDCSPSGRAAGAGLGHPWSDALPPPTARPLGGLPGPVWGVRSRALSHPRLPALWAGCRGRCGASGVWRSPTADWPPSGRAAGAGVGRLGSDALPPPTARPLGGLPGPVWGVRGRTLSGPRLPALWAGRLGRCGASGVGRSPTPDCPPSGRAAWAGVGRPGSGALPPPTARPLGGLPGPVWGVRGRTLSHPRLPALWAGCQGRCGASGVGRSPTPDCPPSGRAGGAGVGRPGSDALPPPTACPLGGLPGPVWGVRSRTLSHPRLPALWAGCRGRCGASGVGRSPTPDCSPSGRAARAGVGRLWSDALPPPMPALWAGCLGRCGAPGVGRSPIPDCSHSGRAAGAGVGRPGSDTLPPRIARPLGRAAGAGVGRPGSGALPPPTARPLGGVLGPVWGVRGRTLSDHRLPALWAGCRGQRRASGVGRSLTPDCPPSGRAAGAGVGRPGSGALPPPTARPSGGLPGCCACACPAWPGWAGRPPGPVLVRLTFPLALLASLFACLAPSGLGLPCLWLLLGFFASCPTPPLVFFFLPPLCAAHCLLLCVFSGLGCPGPWRPVAPPPPPLFVFGPLPLPVVSGVSCFPVAFGLCAPPPPLFFSCPAALFPAARLLCVFWGVVLCVPCPARSLCCARRLCCFWWLVLLVPGVAAFCWGSAGGSGCPALSSGGVCRLWCPCLVWLSLGVLPVVSRSPVLCPVALCCRVVLCCGALSSFFFLFFFCFSPCWWRWFPVVPRWFWAPGRFRVVSVSVLCLCGAVLVCLRRCSLFGALLPSRGWLVFSVVACCVCVFAVGPGCPVLSPGGSWWLLVSCLGGVLWCVPGCCAAPCCCALRRLALRCCALCCFVLLRLVPPRAVLCPGVLSFVLGSCAFWRCVLSCSPALCVFCCGVSLCGFVRRCALCRVRPGVSCCAFLVVSALCGVAVWPALPRCPASLCCAPWCCAAAWCRGVLSCRLAGFVSCVGVVVPT